MIIVVITRGKTWVVDILIHPGFAIVTLTSDFIPVKDFSIDDVIGILCDAGYSVNKTVTNS